MSGLLKDTNNETSQDSSRRFIAILFAFLVTILCIGAFILAALGKVLPDYKIIAVLIGVPAAVILVLLLYTTMADIKALLLAAKGIDDDAAK